MSVLVEEVGNPIVSVQAQYKVPSYAGQGQGQFGGGSQPCPQSKSVYRGGRPAAIPEFLIDLHPVVNADRKTRSRRRFFDKHEATPSFQNAASAQRVAENPYPASAVPSYFSSVREGPSVNRAVLTAKPTGRVSHWFQKEVTFSMSKLSLTGLVFGLIFLGTLFFLIGFLGAVSYFDVYKPAAAPSSDSVWRIANKDAGGVRAAESEWGRMIQSQANRWVEKGAQKVRSKLHVGQGITAVPLPLQPFAKKAQTLTFRPLRKDVSESSASTRTAVNTGLKPWHNAPQSKSFFQKQMKVRQTRQRVRHHPRKAQRRPRQAPVQTQQSSAYYYAQQPPAGAPGPGYQYGPLPPPSYEGGQGGSYSR